MTTYNVFNQQLAASTDAADDDVLLLYDTSAGVNKSVSVAILRSEMGGVVATTATTLTVTAASHAGKTVVINSAAPIAVSLPAATATGNVYTFVIGVAATATASTIAANGTDVVEGVSWVLTTASANVVGYATTATSDYITLNGTTTGGVPGDRWVLIDSESGVWNVQGLSQATGTTATPFAAT